MGKSRIITESAVALAIYIVLLLMTIYVPLLGTIALFTLSLPFVVFTAKMGWKNGLLIIVAATILTLLVGSVMAIPATIFFGISGIVIGQLYKMNKSRYEILTIGSIVFLLNLLIGYGVVITLFDFNFVEEIRKTSEQMLSMAREMMTQFGQSLTENQMKQMEESLEFAMLSIPTMIIVASVFLSFITQLISTPILRRIGFKVEKWPPFRELRLPRSLIWYYLISMVLILIPLDHDSVMFLGVYNLFYILQIIMIIQGFSFIFYYCHYKKLSKGIPITILILMIFLPFLLSIVRIIGIIDLGFNFREHLEKRS